MLLLTSQQAAAKPFVLDSQYEKKHTNVILLLLGYHLLKQAVVLNKQP